MILFIYACLSFCVCLEQCTILYKIDRYIDDQEYSGRRLNTIEREWQLRYHYKRRMNIVISDMDTTNTCDRPLVKLLRIYCCEWNCQSVIFEKFQVEI
jgi:hypothetical protein